MRWIQCWMAVAAMVGIAAGAQAAPLNSLLVTGGAFTMSGVGPNPLHPAAFADMSVDGSYDGSVPPGVIAASEAPYAPISIATFSFGIFGPAYVVTAATDEAGNGPFPGVTGDLTGNQLTLDLRSWILWWKDAINQGATGVTATTDGAGNFTATWNAVVVGGFANGQVGNWTLTGNATAIPEPMSMALVGSGLVALVGLAWRRSVGRCLAWISLAAIVEGGRDAMDPVFDDRDGDGGNRRERAGGTTHRVAGDRRELLHGRRWGHAPSRGVRQHVRRRLL